MDRKGSCEVCKNDIIISKKCDYSILGRKGIDGINKARIEINPENPCVIVYNGNCKHYVHIACRKTYTDPRRLTKVISKHKLANEPCSQPQLRSDATLFSFKRDCLMCGHNVDRDKDRKYPTTYEYQFSNVMLINIKENIVKHCHKRIDEWANVVEARLECIHDLPAVEVLYHHVCYNNFITGKSIPDVYLSEAIPKKKRKVGRPADESKKASFKIVTEYLEKNDDETVEMDELHKMMVEQSAVEEGDVYSKKQLKRELELHYGDRVLITSHKQQLLVVSLKSNLTKLVQVAHGRSSERRKSDDMTGVVELAGELIRAEIKSAEKHSSVYPEPEDMGCIDTNLNHLTPFLRLLLQTVMKSRNANLHTIAIGQAIMNSTCPRSFLSPLHLGLSVTLESKYGKRELVDLMNKFGFVASYAEAQRYKYNAAITQGIDVDKVSDTFMQYVADNVDHDSRTLDGNGTIHCMGSEVTLTPAVKSVRNIARKKINQDDLKQIGSINIVFQADPREVLSSVIYTKLDHQATNPDFPRIDLLWQLSLHLENPRPLWAGYMQTLHKGNSHPGKSSEMFLPMIDLSPSRREDRDRPSTSVPKADCCGDQQRGFAFTL